MKNRTYIGTSEVFCPECKRLVNPLVTVVIEEAYYGHGEAVQEETESSCQFCGSLGITTEYAECGICHEYFDCEYDKEEICPDCRLKQMDESIEIINQLTKEIGRI